MVRKRRLSAAGPIPAGATRVTIEAATWARIESPNLTFSWLKATRGTAPPTHVAAAKAKAMAIQIGLACLTAATISEKFKEPIKMIAASARTAKVIIVLGAKRCKLAGWIDS